MKFQGIRHGFAKSSLAGCVAVCAVAGTGCASEYTVVTRGDVQPSAGTRSSAQNLAPMAAEDPRVAEHLAMAIGIYEKQLSLLKERRNEVRARRRTYAQLALGTLATAAAATAATSILLSDKGNFDDGRKAVGAASLAGLVLGSTLAIVGHAQEDPEAVDEKIRFLESDYQTMLDRLRALGGRGTAEKGVAAEEEVRIRAGAIVEEFISHALAINVKG